MMTYEKIADQIYKLSVADDNEHAEIFIFYLFPGIILGLNYVNIHRITGTIDDTASPQNTLRINYCFEGRCEVKLSDGRYVYVDNNALCIEDHEPQYNFYYPLGFYKGIQIFIDKDVAKDGLWTSLELFGANPAQIIEKFSDTNKTFMKLASEKFSRDSLDIMTVWEEKDLSFTQKLYQIRFLLCKLLYSLTNNDAFSSKPYSTTFLSHSQYMIAMDCERQITKDLSVKKNIETMAKDYKISPSSLKNYFACVFGCSISDYTQTMRMSEAKKLLENTDKSIMQIASAVGYENQSKFSAVFKKHTGYAPLEYKRTYNINRKEENL